MTKISVVFRRGLGSINAEVMRKGAVLVAVPIKQSGEYELCPTQAGDIIMISGVSPESTKVTLNTTTEPATPQEFSLGPISQDYDCI
jgi:hypothetical protein